MKIEKRTVFMRCVIVLMMTFLLFFCLDMRKPQVCHSSVFTTAEQTEIRLYILTRSLFPADEEMLVKEIVQKDQRINGVRDNAKYYLILYHSRFHYRRNKEYKTIVCDTNGIIG